MDATCPHCGNTFTVKRELGTGRKHPRKKYNENHKAIHDKLSLLHKPVSVSELRVNLNTFGPSIKTKRARKVWEDEDCQSVLSDLVGWGFAAMNRVSGRETWVYALKKPRIILEDAVKKMEVTKAEVNRAGEVTIEAKGKLSMSATDAFFQA